jgi:hypothetical protein
MADLVKLISKVNYSDGRRAAVTLGAANGDNSYAAVIQRADVPEWDSAQLWRREALSVTETGGQSWVGFTFSIPSRNGGPRLALQYNGANKPVSVAPYGPQVVQQLWRLGFQDYQNQAAPYAALGIFDPDHPIFLNLFGAKAEDNQPIYAWAEADGTAQVNEYWNMYPQNWKIQGKITTVTQATGVAVPTSVSVVYSVFKAAEGDRNYLQLLLAEPASIFDAAGYAIPSEYAADFNIFYRSHSGVQEVHAALAAGRSLESVAYSSCIACKIGCWIAAIGIAGVGAAGLAVLSTTAAPVVAVAALTGLNPATALALTAFIVGSGFTGVEVIVNILCQIIGVCPW